MKTLQYYKTCFATMNCNKSYGQVAPHKAMMLVAVMEEVANGHITNGFVPHNETMVRAFEAAWSRYVGDSSVFNPIFATPFYHLGNEPFWELMKSNHYVDMREYSLRALRESFFGAKLPDELFGYMEDTASRRVLRRVLLEKYVPQWGDDDCERLAAEGETEYGAKTVEGTVRMVA